MNIIISTTHSKQSVAMLDVKFTSSSMEEKQYFAFLAACCRFQKSKFHLEHWIEVSDHLRNFLLSRALCRSFAKAIIFHHSSIELLVNLTSNMVELAPRNLLFSLEIIRHRYEYNSHAYPLLINTPLVTYCKKVYI